MTEDHKSEALGMSEAEAATAAPPSSASAPDDPMLALRAEREDAVVVLRQRWENVRVERARAQLEIRDDNNPKDPGLIEDERLFKVQIDIEDSIASTPTHTAAGIVAKLLQLQRNETEFDGDAPWRPAAFRTALDALGRNTLPAIEDPVLALKREWDARWERYKDEENRGDEEIIGPLHDRLNEAEFAIHRTPATTPAGIALKLKMWTRNHCPGIVSYDWWKAPLDEFDDDLDELPVLSALHDLERMARTTTVAETPPAEDAALFDALAEYDRLVAIEQALERRKDVFRPGIPEAEEADKAHTAACDEAMAAWERVRKIPATTQAGLLARLQATDRYVTDLGEETIFEEDWSVITADVQRITGEAGS